MPVVQSILFLVAPLIKYGQMVIGDVLCLYYISAKCHFWKRGMSLVALKVNSTL